MFLSRLEGMLGYVPGLYRTTPAAKRRRLRPSLIQKDEEASSFFATSGYGSDANEQARKKEVSRLFARMRSELLEIAHDFAEEESSMPDGNPAVRQGVFIEMIVASEFVVDELDSEIAALCLAGTEAEKNQEPGELNEICQSAALLSRLRNRISELQHELDSMLEITRTSFHRYSLSLSLNFDPMAQDGQGGQPFVAQFLQSIDEAISTLSQFASTALQERDFETAAQLCSCNLQLSNFLCDANRIIAAV